MTNPLRRATWLTLEPGSYTYRRRRYVLMGFLLLFGGCKGLAPRYLYVYIYVYVFSKKTQMSGNCFRSSLPCSNHWKSIFLSHTWRCFPTHCTPLYKVNTSSHCLFLRRRTFLQHVCVKRSYCWSEISQRQAVSKWLARCSQFWCGRFFPLTPTLVMELWNTRQSHPKIKCMTFSAQKLEGSRKQVIEVLVSGFRIWYSCARARTDIIGTCVEYFVPSATSNDPPWDQRTMRSDDEVICVFCLCCPQKASSGIMVL